MRTPKEFSPISPNEGYKENEEKKVPSKPAQPPAKDFQKLSQEQKVTKKPSEKPSVLNEFSKLTPDKHLKSKKFDDSVEDESLEAQLDLMGMMETEEPHGDSIFKIASTAPKTEKPVHYIPRSMERPSVTSKSGPARQTEKPQPKDKVPQKEKVSDAEHISEDEIPNTEQVEEGVLHNDATADEITISKDRLSDDKFAEMARTVEPKSNRLGGDFENSSSKSGKSEKVLVNPGQPTRVDIVAPPPVDLSANTQFTTAAQEAPRINSAVIIQQLADQIVVVTQNGQTDTQVALKNIPGFEGATITITENDTSPGQINVTFGNLKPDAENMIRENIDTLRNQLRDNANIILQQVVVTQQETSPLPGDTQKSERGREREEGGGSSGGEGGEEGGQNDQQQQRRQR